MTQEEKFDRTGRTMLMLHGTFNICQRLCCGTCRFCGIGWPSPRPPASSLSRAMPRRCPGSERSSTRGGEGGRGGGAAFSGQCQCVVSGFYGFTGWGPKSRTLSLNLGLERTARAPHSGGTKDPSLQGSGGGVKTTPQRPVFEM